MREELRERLYQLHHHGELDACIAELEADLRSLDETPFHWILEKDLLQNAESVASYLAEFAEAQTYDFRFAHFLQTS